MKHSELLGIPIQKIVVFLKAAEVGNFSLAAEELHMTQATVSRNISSLEETLGIILFVRHKGKVYLTNAAKKLQKDWSDMIKRLDKSIDDAQFIQQNRLKRLVIADDDISPSSTYLMPIIEKFEFLYPEVELVIERNDPAIMLHQLYERKYDAAFFQYTNPEFIKACGLDAFTIMRLDPYLTVSEANPLAGSTEIQIEDLTKYPLVTVNPEGKNGTGTHSAFVHRICKELDITFNEIYYAESVSSLSFLIERGKYITFLNNRFGDGSAYTFKYIPIPNISVKSEISLAYMPDNDNHYLYKFLDICKRLSFDFA